MTDPLFPIAPTGQTGSPGLGQRIAPPGISQGNGFFHPEIPVDGVLTDQGNWIERHSKHFVGQTGEFFGLLAEDYRNFYHPRSLVIAVPTLGLGALMANTDIDEDLLKHYRGLSPIPSGDWHKFVAEFKYFGEAYIWTTVYLSLTTLDNTMLGETAWFRPIGQWGEKSLRASLVGFPMLMLSQYTLGASRPGETIHGSRWKFSGDNNGVSGHSFKGAIPFLTAAGMTERPLVKIVFVALSTLPAFSRMTDNAHFPSQAIMGWSLAYLATSSVQWTDYQAKFQVRPMVSANMVGLGLTISR